MENVSSYPNWTREKVHQLLDSLGEEKAKDIVDGKVSVEFKELVNKLFDEKGRRNPKGLQAKVCDPDKSFRLDKPDLSCETDFAIRLKRLHESLGTDTKITAQQFKQETEHLLQVIKEDPKVSNLAKAICLPVVLPKLMTNDLGSELELYLLATNHSYKKVFGNRKFINSRQGVLAGQVSAVDESRHDQLIEKMQEGAVVGLYFPNSLQGFSVHASREQISTLPEGFILSGLDTAIAMLMYPDILARDFNTPGLDLAALQYKSLERSLGFRAGGGGLYFGSTGDLVDAFDYCSGGLFFFR
jgi:hypothetical protein